MTDGRGGATRPAGGCWKMEYDFFLGSSEVDDKVESTTVVHAAYGSTELTGMDDDGVC